MRRLLRTLLLAACLTTGTACDRPADPAPVPTPTPAAASDTAATAPADALLGETVYVSVYSHIFYQDERQQIDLAATLSIRNTDPDAAITVTGVRYYDSEGRLVRAYLDAPLTLPPLASRAYVVPEQDRTGGVGANFMVDWHANAAVSRPVIEAVMISTASTLGLSFVSRGHVVRRHGEAPLP